MKKAQNAKQVPLDKTEANIIAKSLQGTTSEDFIMDDISDNGKPHKYTNGKKVAPTLMEIADEVHTKILGQDNFKAGADAAAPTSRPIPQHDAINNLSTEKPSFTLDEFNHAHPGVHICSGVAYYARNGYNRHGIGTPKRFVAIMGGGGESWAVYVGSIFAPLDFIASDGDKACTEDHIKQLVNCEETISYYRF